jgi:hypothetical protein
MWRCAQQTQIMSETIAQPLRPNCPALIICQQIQTTPQRLINIAGMMNAFTITEFPADVTFAVHFALTEGQGDYQLALFLESPNYPNDAAPSRHLVWEGDVSLRTPQVVHEQPAQVTTRFHAPGQWLAGTWWSILHWRIPGGCGVTK